MLRNLSGRHKDRYKDLCKLCYKNNYTPCLNVRSLQSKYQSESEQTRLKVEDAKEIMHAELLRKSAQKIVDVEVEKERIRKLEELEKMVRGEGENEMEIAQTSENLSKVQNDLKNAFKISTVSILCQYKN